MLAGQQGANLVEDMKNVKCSPVPVLIKKSPMKDRAHKAGTEVRLTTDKATGEYRLDEDYYNEAGVMFSMNNVARQVDIDNTKSLLHDHYTYAFDGKGPARLGGDVTFDINLESKGFSTFYICPIDNTNPNIIQCKSNACYGNGRYGVS